MKTFLIAMIVAFVAMAAVDARPKGRSNRLPQFQRAKLDKSSEEDRKDFKGPAMCKITNSAGAPVAEKECRHNVSCSNTAAVQFTSASQTYNVFFCDVPFPSLKMACKTVDSNGVEHPVVRSGMTCNDCSVGPYEAMDPCNNTVNYYICAGMPTQANFSRAILRRACEVNGEEEHECKDSKPCEGVELTVDSVKARYCQATTDQGFNWIDLFGKSCDGKKKGRGNKDSSSSEESEESESTEQEEADSEEEVIKCQPSMTTAAAPRIP